MYLMVMELHLLSPHFLEIIEKGDGQFATGSHYVTETTRMKMKLAFRECWRQWGNHRNSAKTLTELTPNPKILNFLSIWAKSYLFCLNKFDMSLLLPAMTKKHFNIFNTLTFFFSSNYIKTPPLFNYHIWKLNQG